MLCYGARGPWGPLPMRMRQSISQFETAFVSTAHYDTTLAATREALAKAMAVAAR